MTMRDHLKLSQSEVAEAVASLEKNLTSTTGPLGSCGGQTGQAAVTAGGADITT